jgi:hypothetical protein
VLHSEKEIQVLDIFASYPVVFDRTNLMVIEVDKTVDKVKPGYASYKLEEDFMENKLAQDQAEQFTHVESLGLQGTLMAQAYVRVHKMEQFAEPERQYLLECCKNTFSHYQLKGEDPRHLREFAVLIRKPNSPSAQLFTYPVVKQQAGMND